MRFSKKELKIYPALLWTSTLGLLFLITGCTNSFQLGNSSVLSTITTLGTSASPSPSPSSTQDTEVIANGTIVNSSSNAPTPAPSSTPSSSSTTSTLPAPTVTLFFDTTKSTAPINNHCNTAASGGTTGQKPCLCQFTWIQVNPNAAANSNSSIKRSVQTSLTNVQAASVTCNGPDVYNSEILDGTQLTITVVPASNNPDSALFTVNSYLYTKNNAAVVGSFQDSNGQMFDNILHYGCYEKFQRGMSIQSKSGTQTNSTTQVAATYLFASQFCVTKASGGASSATGCSGGTTDFSAQANYYNLYIRNSEQGDINLFNDGLVCPVIKETLNTNGTVGTQNQVWPLDSTFALSLGATSTFSVGVIANVELNSANPVSVSGSCFQTATTTSSTSTSTTSGSSITGFVQSCLGFAAKVNSDGTCPYFKDASGQIQFTYRLRRYVAIYPKTYDSDGSVISSKSQGIDTIYVLDRPVIAPPNSNPLKPFTMKGPKPCPFAYFDHANVTNISGTGNPSYLATNNTAWTGKNIDGIQFPNSDSLSGGSCSAAIPVVDLSKTAMSIMTVNIHNANTKYQHVYIRPTQAFSPHYEEDTSFQACAPQANPTRDAPLHFARDPNTNNVAWCVESYPTQNQNIQKLDPANPANSNIPSGAVANYTSHTQKNSASAPCTATTITIPTTNYNYASATGTQYALHLASTPWESSAANVTCDRTVMNQSTDWPRYPLLAPSSDLESAIQSDSSYFCTLTFDNNGPKTNKFTPSSGCCNSSSVFVTSSPSSASTAHLEPDAACRVPSY